MNTPQSIPRIDCQRFAKCGIKSLAHCRQYRGTAEDCAGCQLIRRKPKNRMIASDGQELKLCTKCGRWLPLFRFYEQNVVRNGKVYHPLTSECRQCKSTKVNNQRKSKSYETIKQL